LEHRKKEKAERNARATNFFSLQIAVSLLCFFDSSVLKFFPNLSLRLAINLESFTRATYHNKSVLILFNLVEKGKQIGILKMFKQD